MSKEKSVNRVEVSGFLRNANLRSTSKGTPVCSFSLALIDSAMAGEPRRTFLNAVAWQGQAQKVGSWPLDSRVYIVGRLQTNSWTDVTTGTKRYKTEIVCESVDLTDSLLRKPATEITPARPIDDSDVPF